MRSGCKIAAQTAHHRFREKLLQDVRQLLYLELVPDCWQRLDSGKMVQGRRQVMAREASMLVVTVVSHDA